MFEGWDSFYLLVGSAAGALVGLLFVVASLTVGIEENRAERGSKFFMSPTVFHLAAVFVISAITMVPRISGADAALVMTAVILVGLTYAVRNALALRQAGVAQHWTDFWSYGVGPIACYLALAVLCWLVSRGDAGAPPLLASVLVLFVLLCIRNAWDLVTWIAGHEKRS
jgi:hypothetical protein